MRSRKSTSTLAIVETLEGRTLMSITVAAAGTVDSSFATAGHLTGYLVTGVKSDGSLVGRSDSGNLVSIGTSGAVGATIQPTSGIPGTPGKILYLSHNVLTRLNSNGSLDTTFSTDGKVTDFTFGTGFTAFNVETMVLQGSKILVAGEIPATGGDYLAVERLNSDGSIDRTFGVNGLAHSLLNTGTTALAYGVRNARTSDIYITGQENGNPGVVRFGPNGKAKGQAFVDTPTSQRLITMTVQANGQVLLVTGWNSQTISLSRFNADLTVDTAFATTGRILLSAPTNSASVTQAGWSTLVLSSNRIYLGMNFKWSDGSKENYTFSIVD